MKTYSRDEIEGAAGLAVLSGVTLASATLTFLASIKSEGIQLALLAAVLGVVALFFYRAADQIIRR